MQCLHVVHTFDQLHADVHMVWKQPPLFRTFLFLCSLDVLQVRETLSKELLVFGTNLRQASMRILNEAVSESAQTELH